MEGKMKEVIPNLPVKENHFYSQYSNFKITIAAQITKLNCF